MDLNLVVLCGKLREVETKRLGYKRSAVWLHMDINDGELVTVEWHASDDDLETIDPKAGDRLWVSGKVSEDIVVAAHVQKVEVDDEAAS